MNDALIEQAVLSYGEQQRAALIRLATQRGLDASEAEGAVNAAVAHVVRLVRGGEVEWRDGEGLASYVRGQVVLQAQNLRRADGRRQKHVLVTDEMPDPGTPQDDARDPPTAAQKAECVDWIAHALAQLPVVQRAVLILKEFEGLPWSEVAKLLGSTVSKVRTIKDEAVDEMRRLLPAHLAENGEPLKVPFLDLGGTLHRLQVALRPRPITDEDGRLLVRLVAPTPGAAPPKFAFALLRVDDGDAIYAGRPTIVDVTPDPDFHDSWLANLEVQRLDGTLPRPGAQLVGMWLFALNAPAHFAFEDGALADV